MMPMMQFGRAEQHAERAERQSYIRMQENGPQPPKCENACQRFQRKTKHEGRQIYYCQCVNGIDRMFPVRGKPVQVFGAVMDRVKSPKKLISMLKPVPPIYTEVAQQKGFGRQQPPWLGTDCSTNCRRNHLIQPTAKNVQQSQNRSAPNQILAEEKRQVRPPVRPNELLRIRRKEFFQWPKHQRQECE